MWRKDGWYWGWQMIRLCLVPGPFVLAGSLEQLFSSDFLICKVGRIKYFFSRVVMKTK